MVSHAHARRRFLTFLAASPLALPLVRVAGAWTQDPPVIASPGDALNVFDFEAAARRALPPAHFGYLATGVDDDRTLRANREGYERFRSVTEGLVRRATTAGCPVLVLTVDLQGGSNRETVARAERSDPRDCTACHQAPPPGSTRRATSFYVARKPMFSSLDVSLVTSTQPRGMTWDVTRRLRDLTPMKLVLKGIVTREDAELAVQHGVDAIVVSNHGGRAEESGRASIDSLVEVVEGVRGRIPVLVDGGIRRGTDIFKALALGASAVLIGRPYAWGLGAFGQPGVEAVLDILTAELQTIMRQAGARTIAEITRSHVVT